MAPIGYTPAVSISQILWIQNPILHLSNTFFKVKYFDSDLKNEKKKTYYTYYILRATLKSTSQIFEKVKQHD